MLEKGLAYLALPLNNTGETFDVGTFLAALPVEARRLGMIPEEVASEFVPHKINPIDRDFLIHVLHVMRDQLITDAGRTAPQD
jgi:hypothetical protein